MMGNARSYGYEPLTDGVRRKILGANAARVDDLDLEAVAALKDEHGRAWALELVDRYQQGKVQEFR